MTTDLPTSSDSSPEQRFLVYARTGDKAVIQSLISEYTNRSYNQARRIIGNDDDAEDAVQEAFLSLVKTAQRYTGQVPFAAWLARLVTSRSIDHLRGLRRHKKNSFMGEEGTKLMKNQIAPPQNQDQPVMEALRTALISLPEHYRAPLTLYYFGGLNQGETAKALGAPLDRIEKQLARGLERLREKLGRAGFSVTSAGLLTIFASIPSYAASPEFTAGLVVSERLTAQASSHILANSAWPTTGTAVILKGMIVVIAAGAALSVALYSHQNSQRPMSALQTASPLLGLIAHWPFDEGRGATARSACGIFDAATLMHGPTWITGGGLNFDGVDDYVAVDHREVFNSPSLTVSFHINIRHQNEIGQVIMQKLDLSDTAGWYFWLYPSEGGNASKMAWLTAKDGSEYEARSMTAIRNNTTYAVAGTYSDGTLKLYINGNLEATIAGAKGATSDPLYMGCEDGELNDSGQLNLMHGSLADVRFYDRALSDAEIAAEVR